MTTLSPRPYMDRFVMIFTKIKKNNNHNWQFTGGEVCSVCLLHAQPDREPGGVEGPLHLRPHLPHPQG